MTRLRSAGPSLVFLASALMMLASVLAGVKLQPFHPVRSFGFFDLVIYRESAQTVLAGHPLYAARFQDGFGFTYPRSRRCCSSRSPRCRFTWTRPPWRC